MNIRSHHTNRNMRFSAAILSLAMAMAINVGTPGEASAAGATVKGSVKFDGPRPEPKLIDNMRDRTTVGGRGVPSECSALHTDDPLYYENEIVGEKGEITNVVVFISKGVKGKFDVPTEPALLNQEGCAYSPHVQVVRLGQTLQILNSDNLMHNVRSYAKKNRGFNIGQPVKGAMREKTFRRVEEAVKIKCDIHTWMQSWVFALDHPFHAVTAADGLFAIEGLPAGEYTLTAWHETYGKQKEKITVGESGDVEIDFTFKPKEK